MKNLLNVDLGNILEDRNHQVDNKSRANHIKNLIN